MSSQGNQNGLVGVLVVDKPRGLSSMSVVSVVRRRAGRARTGHAGTLDPLATGVLVMAIGRAATRSIDAFMGTSKRYHTRIDLSAFTATDDAEAEPEFVTPARGVPGRRALEAALDGFRGTFDQRPPDFSAVKIDGRRAYATARKGEAPATRPRAVTVHGLSVLAYAWPTVDLAIHSAKGFYVRSLARDLGTTLGTGGYCRSIRRTAVGPFTLRDAVPLDDVPEALAQADLLPLDDALARLAEDAPARDPAPGG